MELRETLPRKEQEPTDHHYKCLPSPRKHPVPVFIPHILPPFCYENGGIGQRKEVSVFHLNPAVIYRLANDYKCRRKALVQYRVRIYWVINPTSISLWSSGQPLTWPGPKHLIEHKHKGTHPGLALSWLPKSTAQWLSSIPFLRWRNTDKRKRSNHKTPAPEPALCKAQTSQFKFPGWNWAAQSHCSLFKIPSSKSLYRMGQHRANGSLLKIPSSNSLHGSGQHRANCFLFKIPSSNSLDGSTEPVAPTTQIQRLEMNGIMIWL